MKDCLGGGVRGICMGQEIGNEEVIWLVAILRIEPGQWSIIGVCNSACESYIIKKNI